MKKILLLAAMTTLLFSACQKKTGLFAGEDALENLQRFKDRVAHIHLKDRAAENDMRCVPAGTGCIPMADILRTMEGSGYQGWYTIEQYGSRNMLSDSQESINNIRTLLNGLKK